MNISRALITSKGNYHMSLEIELQKEVSEVDCKIFVRYSLDSPVGIIILTDDF